MDSVRAHERVIPSVVSKWASPHCDTSKAADAVAVMRRP